MTVAKYWRGRYLATNSLISMIGITIILIATYALISTEKINKTVAALLGGLGVLIFVKVTFLATGAEVFTDAAIFEELIDWQTITIVVSILIVVEAARESGLFDWITIKIVKLTKGEPIRIFLYMNLLTFALSALTSSPAFVIVGALTLVVTKNLDLDPKPFLVSEIMIANTAGACTVISSFVNILIATNYEFTDVHFLSYGLFAALAVPIGGILVVVNLIVFRFIYGKKLQEADDKISPDLKRTLIGLDEWLVVKNRSAFYRSAILLIGTIVTFALANLLNVPFFLVALTSAILFIFFSDNRVEVLLHKVDWEMVIFFVAIFILVGGAHKVGILDIFAQNIGGLSGGNEPLLLVILVWMTGILSGFMDNVSVTAVLVLVIPTIAAGGFNETAIIWAVILGANLGASLTPIGGVSNIIGIGLLEREGKSMSWLDFIKLGSIITFIDLAVATGYLFLIASLFFVT
jgi:Na+/H+ antiporter NhaD/arsenite permease-like protein